MSLIRLNDVSKRFDRRPVLRAAHMRLGRGDKIGLIGKNGVGKTTLLNLILGNEAPDTGTVDVTTGVSIGYFSQFSSLAGAETVEHIALAEFADVRATEAELFEIGAALERSTEHALLNRQAVLLEQMEVADGWT